MEGFGSPNLYKVMKECKWDTNTVKSLNRIEFFLALDAHGFEFPKEPDFTRRVSSVGQIISLMPIKGGRNYISLRDDNSGENVIFLIVRTVNDLCGKLQVFLAQDYYG